MIQMNLSFSVSSEVVLSITRKFNLEPDKICGLLAELKINYPPVKPYA